MGAVSTRQSAKHSWSGRQVLGALAALLACIPDGVTAATAERIADDSTQFALKIEPQPLDAALQSFARQSGIQIAFFSSVTDGLRAPALEGRYTLDAAMDTLLSGSSLRFRVLNPQTIEIQAGPPQSRDKARSGGATASVTAAGRAMRKSKTPSARSDPMQQVVVTGVAEQLVATRISTPLSKIPQTVSLISSEQMRQQNVTDLADALYNAPGITMVRTNSLEQQYFSRAYQITSFHVDGGAALNPRINSAVLFSGAPDISEFDHVEVLRGSDALFGGNGEPGGTVSLVRKRPRDRFGLDLNASGGSWKSRRAEIDVTGPIAADGALRGRVDALYSHRNYFYDTANLERKKIFGVVEYDLTPETLLTAGGSFQWDDAIPFLNGLPLFDDGNDSRLPRDTALTFDWAYQRTRLSETYLQLRQGLGEDWALKLNASRWRAKVDYLEGGFSSTIDPITNSLDATPSAFGTGRPNLNTQTTFDVTLAGMLNWFGWREELAIGGDFTRLQAGLDLADFDIAGPRLTDVRAFDRRNYATPGTDPLNLQFDGTSTLDQYGVFASLRVYFDEAWSVVGGARIGSDSIDTRLTLRGNGLAFPLSASFGNHHVVTPYGGIMYDINEHYSLYASYADIYKTVGTAFRRDGRLIGPASGVNIETGIKGSWREGALNGSLVVYRIRQSNLPLPDPVRPPPEWASSLYCCFVTGASRSKGADLEINGEAAEGWLVGAGYTYNMNEDTDGDLLSRATPRHLLKAWTSKRLPGNLRRWTVGGSLHAQTQITTPGTYCSPGTQQCHAFDVIQGATAVLDLRAAFEMDRNWQLALSLDNALDKNYYETLVEPLHVWYGEPRNFTLRVDGRF